jgi:hypothetical protein
MLMKRSSNFQANLFQKLNSLGMYGIPSMDLVLSCHSFC